MASTTNDTQPVFDTILRHAVAPSGSFCGLPFDYPPELALVLLNLISNGFHAGARRKAEAAEPDDAPSLTVGTERREDRVTFCIRDNGTGLSSTVLARMLEPFFTTKPAGEGGGLGLSLSHDIVVKQHGRTITVASEVGLFIEIRVTLPRGQTQQTLHPARRSAGSDVLAPVDVQFGAVHVARLIAAQIEDGIGDLIGPAEATHRHLAVGKLAGSG